MLRQFYVNFIHEYDKIHGSEINIVWIYVGTKLTYQPIKSAEFSIQSFEQSEEDSARIDKSIKSVYLSSLA